MFRSRDLQLPVLEMFHMHGIHQMPERFSFSGSGERNLAHNTATRPQAAPVS